MLFETGPRRVRCALLFLFISTAGWAQVDEASVLRGERPNPESVATEVLIDAVVLDLDAIDDAGQRFTIDLYVEN